MEAPSCDCGTQNQNPGASIHVFHPGCPDQKNGLDPWHYTGSRSYHGDLQSAEFLTLCKEKLPQRELPITLGRTGYLNFELNMLSETSAWCLDELGRVAILLNGNFMFQRYVNGDVLMKFKQYDGFSQVTDENLIVFTSMLA